MVKLIKAIHKWKAIIKCWYCDPQIQENCKKLGDSVPKRVKMVIKSRGGHTRF